MRHGELRWLQVEVAAELRLRAQLRGHEQPVQRKGCQSGQGHGAVGPLSLKLSCHCHGCWAKDVLQGGNCDEGRCLGTLAH